MNHIIKNTFIEPAGRYFDYLARKFPVMCASDEFHFIPRAENAVRYYDKIDNLDAAAVEECIFTLKNFQNDFDRLAAGKPEYVRQGNELEILTDIELLKSSVHALLIELHKKQTWRHNPLLYLKIAFIGLDHAITKPASDQKELTDRVLSRLNAIPGLFQQADANIDFIPRPYRQSTSVMIRDCKSYLIEIRNSLLFRSSGYFSESIERVLSSLKKFSRFLLTAPSKGKSTYNYGNKYGDREALEDTIQNHFRSGRSLKEIYQIGMEEWHRNLERLKKYQNEIDPEKTWKELYDSYCTRNILKMETISLYRKEFELLYKFFSVNGFGDIGFNSSLEICETPAYLQSIRGSASFSAASANDREEKDFFFITTRTPRVMSKKSARLLREQLHREYKFLTAHETFPGHHLLDCFRRGLDNPVRRQIESPLFYEGWAYYAESLLSEYGYVKNTMDLLIDARRCLWRAARCRIDVGLTSGILNREDAEKLLITAGFTEAEAKSQIDRFQLNPGYQLCYSLGRYEILKLKEKYATLMGQEQFHRRLLEGGELPFHLIMKAFENFSTE